MPASRGSPESRRPATRRGDAGPQGPPRPPQSAADDGGHANWLSMRINRGLLISKCRTYAASAGIGIWAPAIRRRASGGVQVRRSQAIVGLSRGVWDGLPARRAARTSVPVRRSAIPEQRRATTASVAASGSLAATSVGGRGVWANASAGRMAHRRLSQHSDVEAVHGAAVDLRHSRGMGCRSPIDMVQRVGVAFYVAHQSAQALFQPLVGLGVAEADVGVVVWAEGVAGG